MTAVVSIQLAVVFVGGLAQAAPPGFYPDVLPILQHRCQECHRAGGIAPMRFESYRDTRPWAKAILSAVVSRKMPPWFADPHYRQFTNDRSLTPAEVETIVSWVKAGAPEGSKANAPLPLMWPDGWTLGVPDAVVRMPQPIVVPPNTALEYQYVIVPATWTGDRWVQKAELRPGDRSVVHHAVVYVREKGSAWLSDKPVGLPFTIPERDPDAVTKNDILFTYTPGNSYDQWPAGMAKLIPAGADLVFQMHYSPAKKAARDQSQVGLFFANAPPERRVLTLQLTDNRLYIPPGDPDYRVSIGGTLPNSAVLLSLYPHMHLRGKAFEYAVTQPGGARQILLKVNNYDFYWQLNYRLAVPMYLAAGTKIECQAIFDNSKNNPHNPDPEVLVRYGPQSTDEMMIGFFDVAVEAAVDKVRFFQRRDRTD